jgi:type I restriction enzyme, S subunit
MMKYKFDELIIDSRTGLNPRKNFVLGEGDNNYITIKDIRDGKIVISDKTDKVDDEAIQIIKKRSRIKNGDILFSSIGRVGDTAIVTNKDDSWDVNESVFIFTINKDLITPEYFSYLMSSKSIQDELNKNSTGSTFKSVKMGQLQKMVYDVPTLEEQVLISNQLKKTGLILQNKKQQLTEYDQLIKSRFVEMFEYIDLSKNLKNWIKLGEVSEIVTGTTPSTNQEVNWGGHHLWITPSELDDNSFYVYNTERKLTDVGLRSKSLTVMPINTVLLSTRAPIGKTAIVGTPMSCNQGFKNFICKDNLNPIYLFTLLKYNKEYLNSIGSGTTFKEISKSTVSNIAIPVPNIMLQKQFAQFYQQVDKLKFEKCVTLN